MNTDDKGREKRRNRRANAKKDARKHTSKRDDKNRNRHGKAARLMWPTTRINPNNKLPV